MMGLDDFGELTFTNLVGELLSKTARELLSKTARTFDPLNVLLRRDIWVSKQSMGGSKLVS